MNLKLVNTLISEGKLFRNTGGYRRFNGRDIADLLYINTLAVFLLNYDTQTAHIARDYAKKTAQYGSYALFRTHATDLYLQSFVASFPLNTNVKLEDHDRSTKFLQGLRFLGRDHQKIMRRLGMGNVRRGEMIQYLYRLESQLKISSSKLKQVRRQLGNWEMLRYPDKQRAFTYVLQELRRVGRTTQQELYQPLAKLIRQRSFETEPMGPRSGESSAAAKVAGAAAGAYIAHKLAPDKYKSAGGLAGGVAGYKLASRRSQR